MSPNEVNNKKERIITEKELSANEEKMRWLFSVLPDGVAFIDENYKLKEYNASIKRILGITDSELKEGLTGSFFRRCQYLYPDNTLINIEDLSISQLLEENGIVEQNEIGIMKENGETKWVLISAAPLNNPGSGFVVVISDITERKKTEENLHISESRYRYMIENMNELVTETDMEGNLVFASPKFKDIIGHDLEERMGKSVFDLIHFEDIPHVAKTLSNLSQTNKESVQFRLKRKNGEWCWIESTGSTYVSEDDTTHSIIVSRDITERKIAEDLIKESEERFRYSFQYSPIGMTLTANGIWTQVNTSFCSMVGYSEEELVGRSFDYLTHPDDLYITGDVDIKIFDEKVKTTSVEKRYIHKNGEIIWSRTVVSPVRDENDKFLYTIAQIQNITERKRVYEELNNREQFLSTLFHSVGDAILTVSIPNSTIVHANQAVENIFGYSNSEIIEKSIRQLFIRDEDYIDFDMSLLSAIESEHPGFNKECRFLKKEGNLIWCDVQISFIKENGKVKQYITVIRDISEKKEMVEELIASKEKAEEMSRLKSNFLANMSHELRTPLIGINGFAEFLRTDLDDPELKSMAETIFKSGTRLSETLNLILDLSKFESEKMEFLFQEIDLVTETEEIVKLFSEIAKSKGIFLRTEYSHSQLMVESDARAFRSVLNNLINNAIKFTGKGGITVKLGLDKNIVEIKVIDSGIGISKENHSIIFKEFRQVSEGYGRNFEGTGLGLNIAKRTVEKLNGEIFVESELGKGSTFIVRLPVIRSISKQIKNPSGEIIDLQVNATIKHSALLVDDDPVMYPVLKRYLGTDVDLDNSTDGNSAIKQCLQKQYDFIFMDINLRFGLDGKQVTKKIRQMKGYNNIPIIATTSYTMEGDREEFLAAGCSHYLAKPFNQLDIWKLLKEIRSSKTS